MTNKTFIEQVKELDKARTPGEWENILYGSVQMIAIRDQQRTDRPFGFYVIAQEEESGDSLQLLEDGSMQAVDFDLIALAPKMAKALIAVDELLTKYNDIDTGICGIGMIAKLQLCDDIRKAVEGVV